MIQLKLGITLEILQRISEIERLIGRYEGLNHPKPNPALRRSSRIRTIQVHLLHRILQSPLGANGIQCFHN